MGAGKSQGGQTLSAVLDAYQINLANFNKLIRLDVRKQVATVQAGMTWGQLQQAIAPHQLAVKAMQSYNDFSIGGSLGVNVHGQDLVENPLIKTVKSCKILQADGTVVTASRTQNPELFSLAIGGYGLFGIIIEVTLSLVTDATLNITTTTIASDKLVQHFMQNIKDNPGVEFYSARFSLDPNNPLEKAAVITYEKNSANSAPTPATINNSSKRIIVMNWLLRNALILTKKFPSLKNLRFRLEQYLFKSGVTSRNNFMSYSISSLPQDSSSTHYILQEYFIPYDYVPSFINHLRATIQEHSINILNISARHVCKDSESFLSFARTDCCAFVLYIPVHKDSKSYAHTVTWTQQLINKALACHGTYYLPYQLIATRQQLDAAYPVFKNFVQFKKKYDPQELFTNKFYETYK